MTEAMSRTEIEDVLVSIRRLVAQDPAAKRAIHAASDKTPGVGPDKLILTSALRVDPEGARADNTSQPPEGVQPVAGDGAAPNSAPPDAGAAPDPAPPLVAESSLLQRIHKAGVDVPEMPPVETKASDGTEAAPADPRARDIEDSALEATLARLEAALSASISPSVADSARPVAAEAPAPQPDPAQTPEQVIDESMLYQLVAQIVRQELQGELGEKITRNNRKLVRAEVARELALRKL